jgi:DNA modification methylase
VTSPPYWGLRDYGTGEWEGGEAGCDHKEKDCRRDADRDTRHTDGRNPLTQSNCALPAFRQFGSICGKCGARRIDSQLGLEATPAEYIAKLVAVFRDVWRVLRDDGTLWVNMGDSYTAGHSDWSRWKNGQTFKEERRPSLNTGLKPKDLCMMPARLAMALQAPWYSGSIKYERDRIWLAAMLDAEGCMFIHKRKEGQHNGQGYHRTHDNFGPGVEISNTHESVVQRIMSIVGKGSICTQGPDENTRRKQKLYRWNLRTTESKEFIRELYPHLVAKRHQARILYGCPSSGDDATQAHRSLIAMHRGLPPTIDFKDPPTCFERGWTLRSEIIWSKCNPMPESVTDRPTKAHEMIYLLAKQERYFYDADAIRDPAEYGSLILPNCEGRSDRKAKSTSTWRSVGTAQESVQRNGDYSGQYRVNTGRNKRTVWTIATQPYSEAHFATFPEEIPKLCILAGSKPGDTILDPFAGSGTTGKVAIELGRKTILIELNPEYMRLARARTWVTPGFF